MLRELVTGPACEPVTVKDGKLWLNYTADDQDENIARMIAAARDVIEGEVGRALITQTWASKLAQFPIAYRVLLPSPPLLDVDSITYLDGAGTQQTWPASDYKVIKPGGPRAPRGWVTPAYGKTWPIARTEAGSVVITYRAGYGSSGASVPAGLITVLKMLMADFFDNRQSQIVGTVTAELKRSVQQLLWPFYVGANG